MKRAAALLLLVLACSREEQPGVAPRPRDIVPTSRLQNIEVQLAGFGFRNVARIYEGPEYDLVSVRVAGADAEKSWWRLRTLLEPLGAWPVILGDTSLETPLVEHLRESEAMTLRTITEQANAIDPLSWLKKRAAIDRELYEPPRASDVERISPKCDTDTRLVGPMELADGKPYPSVSIVIVPTRESWAAPAFFKFGGWNDCPMPAEHVAMIRYWHDAHGAEVATIAADIVELRVARPPRSRQALAVAQQQFVYAYDIVHQGTISIDCLAAGIDGAPYWFFWWD